LKIDLETGLKPCAIGAGAIGAPRRWHKAFALSLLVLTAACRQDMHDQPKYTAYKPSDFFADQRSARPLVEGTVAQGSLEDDELLYAGRMGGQPAAVFPFAIDEAAMRRGRERYNIFCSPCHGLSGEGDGMVVQRGYRRPPSLHIDRLRQAPPGHIFDIVSNGFGAMPDYAAQIPVRDRWLIAAYLRALQLSQYAPTAELPPPVQSQLK
jgi:mono/diheme cytochrome c family protein